MIPKIYVEAMQSLHRRAKGQKAIDAKIASLIKLGTWKIVDRPAYVRCLTGAFIYKKKFISRHH